MGKNKTSCNGGGHNGGGEAEEVVVAREFLLKVAMHCRCRGCTDKVRGAIRDITLEAGVEAADSSAAESSGEVRLLATADPERLRRRLHKATGKKVDLLLPREPAAKDQGGAGKKKGDPLDDPAFQALLANLQLQAQAQAPARQQYGGGHGAAAAAWAANHQQQQLMGLGVGVGGWNAGGYGETYPWQAPYYPAAQAAPWAAYAYPPPAPTPAHGLGYYGAAAPAWHGY